MSKDKYASIFSPQIEAIVFIILQIFFAGFCKEKHFFAFSVCLHFEWLVEVAQIKTTLALGCSHVKKITRSGRKSYKRI